MPKLTDVSRQELKCSSGKLEFTACQTQKPASHEQDNFYQFLGKIKENIKNYIRDFYNTLKGYSN